MHRVARHNAVLLAVFSELLLAPTLCAAKDPEPEIRVSDGEESSGKAWTDPGFRLQLRFGWERMTEVQLAPPLQAYTFAIEPSYRLSRWFSLGLGLRYSVTEQSEWTGVRWSTTVDASLHPFGGAFLSLGAGYAGMLVQKALPASYYVITQAERLSPPPGYNRIVRCNGDGAIGLARIGYIVPIADSFATGPALQADLQVTRCRGDYVDPRAAAWASAVEWWWSETVQLTWSLAWR